MPNRVGLEAGLRPSRGGWEGDGGTTRPHLRAGARWREPVPCLNGGTQEAREALMRPLSLRLNPKAVPAARMGKGPGVV